MRTICRPLWVDDLPNPRMEEWIDCEMEGPEGSRPADRRKAADR